MRKVSVVKQVSFLYRAARLTRLATSSGLTRACKVSWLPLVQSIALYVP